MNENKSRISPAFPLFLLWVFIFLCHFNYPTNLADDAWFAQILGVENAGFDVWKQFLVGRYEQWTSRIAIEGLLIFVVRHPVLWRACDTLILIFVTHIISRIANPERNMLKNLVIAIVFLIFPLEIVYETGYVTTSLNFSWPLAAAIFGLAPLLKDFRGIDVKPWERIVAYPFLIFACFQEILCVVILLGVLASMIYHSIRDKRFPSTQFDYLAICIVMLIFALTCPGNSLRVMQETATWFPEFAGVSFLQKLEFGFSSMMQTLFLERNLFVLLFCAVLTVAVWVESKHIVSKLISCIPFVFTLFVGTVGGLLQNWIPVIGTIRAWVQKIGTGFVLKNPKTWIPLGVFVVLLVLILLSLRFAIRSRKQFYLLFCLFFMGAVSCIATGFSPTVWILDQRACTFLYLTMAVVFGVLLYNILCHFKTTEKESE